MNPMAVGQLGPACPRPSHPHPGACSHNRRPPLPSCPCSSQECGLRPHADGCALGVWGPGLQSSSTHYQTQELGYIPQPPGPGFFVCRMEVLKIQFKAPGCSLPPNSLLETWFLLPALTGSSLPPSTAWDSKTLSGHRGARCAAGLRKTSALTRPRGQQPETSGQREETKFVGHLQL